MRCEYCGGNLIFHAKCIAIGDYDDDLRCMMCGKSAILKPRPADQRDQKMKNGVPKLCKFCGCAFVDYSMNHQGKYCEQKHRQKYWDSRKAAIRRGIQIEES